MIYCCKSVEQFVSLAGGATVLQRRRQLPEVAGGEESGHLRAVSAADRQEPCAAQRSLVPHRVLVRDGFR